MDLTAIYKAFDADVPLPAGDNERYVDLSKVRGNTQIAKRLAQRVKNAGAHQSHHLLMGHTKCGKTTELNRVAQLLRDDGYITVFFDIAEFATRTFEYTSVLLLMAEQVVKQLAEKHKIKVKGESIKRIEDFLREREVTEGKEKSVEATAKSEAELGSGLLASFLGKLGFGVELSGGFQRSREITTKIEADLTGFIGAISALIKDAREKVLKSGKYKGLVVICDGCDKLAISATDGSNKTHDLQQAFFVDHAKDLRAVPCHAIYTVPLSIAVNLGDVWEQSTEFVPAIPVNQTSGLSEAYSLEGRKALREVVTKRLHKEGTTSEELFASADLLERLISVSGGHISDLLLLIRDAVLEAQTGDAEMINLVHINRSIRTRALECTRLIEQRHLDTLWAIDCDKAPQSSDDIYRDLIFKRLALEYLRGDDQPDDLFCNPNCVDLHPLVAASGVYQKHKAGKSN